MDEDLQKIMNMTTEECREDAIKQGTTVEAEAAKVREIFNRVDNAYKVKRGLETYIDCNLIMAAVVGYDHLVLTVPMLDSHNDMLQVKIHTKNGCTVVSDSGQIIGDFLDNGNIITPKMYSKIDTALPGFGVKLITPNVMTIYIYGQMKDNDVNVGGRLKMLIQAMVVVDTILHYGGE